MTTEEKKAYQAKKQREYRQRHSGDPEYRARKAAQDKKYAEKHADSISAKLKAKYALNPEPAKRRARKYQQENADKVKLYRQANRDKRNAQAKAWKAKNREHHLTQLAEWRLTHNEEIKRYSKEYYSVNSEVEKEKSRKWREENPGKFQEQGKRYRKENVIKLLDKNAKRRATLKGVTVEKVDRGEIYIRDSGICGICKIHVPLHEVTLDHIIPLSKGGEHSKRNIQLAHRSCNSAKGSKLKASA